MSRYAAPIAFTLSGALLAFPAGAQPQSAAAPDYVYSLEVGGKGGALLGAEGIAVSPVDPNVRAEMTLHVGTGLPQPFYDWVGASLNGKQVPFAGTIQAVDPSGRAGKTITLANPRLTSVTLGPFDRTSRGAARMDVRLQAVVKAETAKSPKLPRVPPHVVSTHWGVSGYRLKLGGLDTSQVTHINAFTMSPGTGAQLEIAVPAAAAQAFARIAPTPRQRAAVPVDDGQLEVIGADGEVIFALGLANVQLTNFSYGPPTAAGAPRPGMVGVMARLVDLRFGPAMTH